MVEISWRKESVIDLVVLALGLFLFLSPWTSGFAHEVPASWTAWATGIVVSVIAMVALSAIAEWQGWLFAAFGVFAAAAPWAAGFAAFDSTTRVHVLAGLLIAAVGGLRLWLMQRTPRRVIA